MIHVHIRDDEARADARSGPAEGDRAGAAGETDLIVQLSTGGAVTDPEAARLAVLDAGPDMASCTMGTVNFGDDVFLNRWEFIVDLHTRMQERGIVPEYEIFDLGQLTSLQRLLDKHGLPAGGHVHVDFVMGVPGGMPGTTEALVACKQALRDLPEGTTFSATGIGRCTIPVMLAVAVGRRSPAGRHGGHRHVREGPAGRVEHAAGRARGRLRPAGPAPAADAGRGPRRCSASQPDRP